jgi:nucleoside-triphosphatase THEP1
VEYPRSVTELTESLRQGGYLADRGLATTLLVSLSLRRPVLLEGEVGVGKTEVAKVLAAVFGRQLIRLQCYEGITTSQALYEWDYARQMLQIRALSQAEATDEQSVDKLFGPKFLLERPLLEAVRQGDKAVLLIDEIDRADDEFEAFLLEVLSDFQISIPELGTVRADSSPVVILTSNRTRELHDALRRRCGNSCSCVRCLRWYFLRITETGTRAVGLCSARIGEGRRYWQGRLKCFIARSGSWLIILNLGWNSCIVQVGIYAEGISEGWKDRVLCLPDDFHTTSMYYARFVHISPRICHSSTEQQEAYHTY